MLIARDDPLDTYLVHHPEALLGQPVEGTVFDPDNPYVLAPHLCAAAQEQPLTTADLPLFGPTARGLLDDLVEAGLLRRRPQGWFWTDRRRAADLADIRSTGGAQVQLVEADTGRVVGTVDGGRAHTTAHTGAVYVHRGETWQVERLDLDEHVAEIRRTDVDYTTTARDVADIVIVEERDHQMWGRCRVSFGSVDVSNQVTSYLRRRSRTGEVIDETPLDLPVRTLRTSAVWWTVPDDVLDARGSAARGPARLGARRGALLDRTAAAVRDLRPVGHRRGVDRASPGHRRPDRVRPRRAPGRRGVRRAGLCDGARVAHRDPRDHRRLRVRQRLSVLHPVAQVRQRQRPARQGRRGAAARRVARSLSDDRP